MIKAMYRVHVYNNGISILFSCFFSMQIQAQVKVQARSRLCTFYQDYLYQYRSLLNFITIILGFNISNACTIVLVMYCSNIYFSISCDSTDKSKILATLLMLLIFILNH